MLLSIDRVLQLLAEGKSLQKISELADCSPDDVSDVIEKARDILKKHYKNESGRKILIKKKKSASSDGNSISQDQISGIKQKFSIFELSAVPYNDSLIVHVDFVCEKDSGESAIGIILYDKDDQVVGKLAAHIGKKRRVQAALIAMLRAIEVASQYKPEILKVRTGSDFAVKIINGKIEEEDVKIQTVLGEIKKILSSVTDCRIEYVPGQMIEKAGYLAQKALSEKSAGKNVR